MVVNGKDGGWDLSDLEKEIDSAVETLLVKKGDKANPVTQSQKKHPSVEETSIPERPVPYLLLLLHPLPLPNPPPPHLLRHRQGSRFPRTFRKNSKQSKLNC